MAIDSPATGVDLNALLQTAITGGTMSDLFGGKSDGSNFVMGALLGRLLFNQNGDWNNNNSAERASIDAAVSAALANSNQQNNNAMLLLKDIQDSTAEINQNVNQNAQTILVNQLQNQIANLQGQGDIKTGIANGNANIINELHEAEQTVTSAIYNDGDKTRAAIAALAANIPTSRELDLQRQLAVAQEEERFNRLRGIVDSGNVTVTNNINQNQAQAQQQQQINNLASLVQSLLTEQRVTQGILNIGSGSVGAMQTAANTRVS